MHDPQQRTHLNKAQHDYVAELALQLRTNAINNLVEQQNFELAAVLKSPDLWNAAVHAGLHEIACRIYGGVQDDSKNEQYLLPEVANDPRLLGYLTQEIVGYLQYQAIENGLSGIKYNLESDVGFLQNLRRDIHNHVNFSVATVEALEIPIQSRPSESQIQALEMISATTGLDWVLGQSDGSRGSDSDEMLTVGAGRDDNFSTTRTGALLLIDTLGAARELQKVINKIVDELFDNSNLRVKMIGTHGENTGSYYVNYIWLPLQVAECPEFQSAMKQSESLDRLRVLLPHQKFTASYFLPNKIARGSDYDYITLKEREGGYKKGVAIDLSHLLSRKVEYPELNCDDYKITFSKTSELYRFKKLLDAVIHQTLDFNPAITLVGFDIFYNQPVLYIPRVVAESKLFREVLAANEDIRDAFYETVTEVDDPSDDSDDTELEYNRQFSKRLLLSSALTGHIRDRISDAISEKSSGLDAVKLIPTNVINSALVASSPFELFTSVSAVEDLVKEVIRNSKDPVPKMSLDTRKIAEDLQAKIIKYADSRDKAGEYSSQDLASWDFRTMEEGRKLEERFSFCWKREEMFLTAEFYDSRIAERLVRVFNAHLKSFVGDRDLACVLFTKGNTTIAFPITLLEQDSFWKMFEESDLGRIARDLRYVDRTLKR